MLSPHLCERLRDPNYLELHLKAAGIVREISKPRWYDAHFLMIYEAVKRYVGLVRPDRLDAFVNGFECLRTANDFSERDASDVFSNEMRMQIEKVVAEISNAKFEDDELLAFGRHVVHDHPYFSELQELVVPRVSELAGCELEPGYNFLSLYGEHGKCALHMDHPLSMFTLDYCIDQNVQWPIYFSKVADWPDFDAMSNWNPERLLADPALDFHGHVLEPGRALLFSGSSQWHYRNPIPAGGFCNLLFLHYFPKGAEDLVYFADWPTRFMIPELEAICDIYAENYPHLARKPREFEH